MGLSFRRPAGDSSLDRCGLWGQARKLLLHPNRNGFFYVLDRVTGEFPGASANGTRIPGRSRRIELDVALVQPANEVAVCADTRPVRHIYDDDRKSRDDRRFQEAEASRF